MATCKECAFYEHCGGFLPSDLDRDVWHYCAEGRADEIPDVDERCTGFEHKDDFTEVVRCKNCKFLYNDKRHSRCMARGFAKGFRVGPNDFCSRGKRKEEMEQARCKE